MTSIELSGAVFLDRDGTLIEQVHHLTKLEDVKIIAPAINAVKIFNELDLKCFITSNQSVVAREMCSIADVEKIHDFLKDEFAKLGANIHQAYYCPHYPLPEQKNEFQKECNCRKPSPGMMFKAAQEHGINLNKSWMIGDSTTDILAGKNAGCKTILVNTGYAGKDGNFQVKSDFEVSDILEAAKILSREV